MTQATDITQTNSAWRGRAAMLASVGMTITLALQVGTGGDPTPEYYKARGTRGYSFVRYEGIDDTAVETTTRSPAENLAVIRSVLKPSVTDLGRMFGVTRQAIYDWQAGKPIAAQNAARLDELARASDIFAAENLTSAPELLRRRLAGGKTLIDIVREGGSTEDAVRSLLATVRRELQQRQMVEARLAGRARPSVAAQDWGMAMLDEHASTDDHG
jgi:hypothetical protein